LEAITPKPKQKVDPKNPASHPDWAKAVKKGEENLPKMKFESEGQKRDYLREVAKNPNNVPGLPIFYPPQGLGTFSGYSGIDTVKRDMLPCGKRWMKASYDGDGKGTYKCSGCTCQGYKETDLTIDNNQVND